VIFLFVMYFFTRFAIIRLILNSTPPEKVKRK
jgi:hypothetical protein